MSFIFPPASILFMSILTKREFYKCVCRRMRRREVLYRSAIHSWNKKLVVRATYCSRIAEDTNHRDLRFRQKDLNSFSYIYLFMFHTLVIQNSTNIYLYKVKKCLKKFKMREKVCFKLRRIQFLPEPGLPSVRSHIHPSGTRGEFILKLRWREIF